jgi:hypothetical protein
MKMEFNFKEIRTLDVSGQISKRGQFNYLSWSYALDILLQQDPSANWTFCEPITFGETMMVTTTVTAFGKTVPMILPVMDNRNQAIKNPDAMAINKAYMRCIAKNIACFGIGLHIFEGDDLPSEPVSQFDLQPYLDELNQSTTVDYLKKSYFSTYELLKNNPVAQKALEEAKNQKYKELKELKND